MALAKVQCCKSTITLIYSYFRSQRFSLRKFHNSSLCNTLENNSVALKIIVVTRLQVSREINSIVS